MVRTDEELVRLCQDGFKEAFDELMNRYHSIIYDYVASQIRDADIAQDVVQETFLRAYRAISRCTRGSTFAGWLFTIARHKCQEYFRYRHRRLLKATRVSLPRQGPNMDPAAQAQKRETWDLLHKAVDELSEEYRVVLFLKHQNGMSCKQIAQVMGKPLGTITGWLSRAYEILRGRLGKEE